MCVYINRLFKEWTKGPIVLAVDFDDTINSYGYIGNDRDIIKVIKLVKKAQSLGAYIAIFTTADPSRYNSIILKCRKLGIDIDVIDKIEYNILLCDRSGLKESLKILKKAMKLYKLHKSKRE